MPSIGEHMDKRSIAGSEKRVQELIRWCSFVLGVCVGALVVTIGIQATPSATYEHALWGELDLLAVFFLVGITAALFTFAFTKVVLASPKLNPLGNLVRVLVVACLATALCLIGIQVGVHWMIQNPLPPPRL